MDKEPYVILDARGLLLHAYHAAKDKEPAYEPDGSPATTARAAFSDFMEMYPILENIPPRRLIAVWDAGNEYRKKVWPSYKEKRGVRSKQEREDKPVATEEIERLITGAKSVLLALGANMVQCRGVEADDVIAMLEKMLGDSPLGIYTVDADLYQLASDRVNVMIKRHVDAGKESEVEPGLVALHKSLVGDSSDEYPGVRNLGPKGWDQMVETFGIDGMYELKNIVESKNFPAFKQVVDYYGDNKQLNLILQDWETWLKMYDLARLHPELCHSVTQGEIVKPMWARRVPNRDRLLTALTALGCAHLMPRLEQWMPGFHLAPARNESPELKLFMQGLQENPMCAFDFESYDELRHQPFQEATKANAGNFVDVLSQKVAGVSFCVGANWQHTIYMPCRHKETEECRNWQPEHLQWALRYAQQVGPMIAHNAPFEATLCLNDLGVDAGVLYDTRLMSTHIDEDGFHNLKSLSKNWLHYTQQTYKELMESHGVSVEDGMRSLTGEQVLSYGCDDSLVTAVLFDLFWLINKTEGTWDFIRDKEFAFLPTQVDSFLSGVRFDMDKVKKLAEEAEQDIQTGTLRLQELLVANCSEPDQTRAMNLLQELWEFKSAKMFAEGIVDPDTHKQEYQELWEKSWRASVYIPRQEIVENAGAPPVKLTAKKVLQPVAEAVGFTNTPPIEKLTKKFFVEEWFPAADEEIAVDQDPNDSKLDFKNKIKDVINAKAWKAEEDESHQALVAFCAAVIGHTNIKTKVIGDELNFDSPNQMQELLYAKMGLPVRVRSKVQHGSTRDQLKLHGSAATDETAVKTALAEDLTHDDWRYEALESYLKVKKASTQLKLFLRPLPLWTHPRDGLVHPQFTNCGTATHRPTGAAPNLLQLTKKDGGRLRSSVRTLRDDHVIVCADFNGQELRITASESKDPLMLDMYIGEHRKDPHSVTASALVPIYLKQDLFVEKHHLADYRGMHVGYEEFMAWRTSSVDSLSAAAGQIRKVAKAVNFLIVYLGGHNTLARNLGISSDLAKEIMDKVFDQYKRLEPWQKETIAFAERNGYTQTAYGSRRHADFRIFEGDHAIKSRMQRQLVNFTIQGCAADILKEVMATCHQKKVFTGHRATMIAPVYDELVASVPRSAALDFSLALKEAMEVTPPGHAVPMVAEFSYGRENWGELVEVGEVIDHDIIEQALSGQKEAAA